MQVECWGGGGAGGSALRTPNTSTVQYGGGGAGGAYAKLNSYAVTPENTYYINVGAGGVAATGTLTNKVVVSGGDSWINSVNSEPSGAGNCVATGGAGGECAVGNTGATAYGAGGTGTTIGSIGDVLFAGGSGGTVTTSSGYGGSGGGSGGTASNGNSGGTNGVVAAAVTGGGLGGAPNATSGSSGPGQLPVSGPGGGGGGARATAQQNGGDGATGQVVLNYTVNVPLVASFSASPTSGGAPLTVTFTDTSAGTITNRFWDFGDGANTNMTVTNLLYTYQFPGTNTVTLIVRNAGGASTNVQANLIVVNIAVPAVVTNVSMAADRSSFTLAGTGPTDAAYRIFATTNLALPFTNWTPVATGSFSGGAFNFTDPQASNYLLQFYRVVTP